MKWERFIVMFFCVFTFIIAVPVSGVANDGVAS